MEEISLKINSGNIHLQTQCMTTICETIMAFQNKGGCMEQCPELKQLWELASQSDMHVSMLAVETLGKLAKTGFINPLKALQNFIADSVSAKFPGAMVQGVTEIMLYIHKSKLKDGPSITFNIPPIRPVHPYILILTRREESTAAILEEVHYLLHHSHDEIRNNALHILEPMIFYCFCLTGDYMPANPSLLHMLMSSYNINGDNLISTICKMTTMLKNDSPVHLQRKLNFLLELAKLSIDYKIQRLATALLPCLVMSFPYALKLGLSTRNLESYCVLLCDQKTHGCDVTLCALADIISRVSGSLQVSLISIAYNLVSKNDGNPIVSGRLLPSLLQILSGPVHSVDGLSEAAGKLAVTIQVTPARTSSNTDLGGNSYWDQLSLVYPDLRSYLPLIDLCDNIIRDPNSGIEWLSKLASTMQEVSSFHFSILTSIVLYQGSTPETVQEAIKVFEKAVAKNENLGFDVFPILLSRLSREKNPMTQLRILYAMPSIAVDKLTMSMVIKTLLTLWSCADLRHIVLRLMFNLWLKEPRIYPHLSKMLNDKSVVSQQLEIARAFVATSICKEKPSQHGEELLPLLSGFLNESRGRDSLAQISIALDGIATLCTALVIDLRTVWKVIGPKLAKDKRPDMIVKLCDLLSVASKIEIQSEEFDAFLTQIVGILWGWAASKYRTSVNEAAYKALQLFDPNLFRLKMLPNYAREGHKMPEGAATPFEASQNPEDVLTYVPPDAWIQLAGGCPKVQSSYIEGFIKALVGREVMALPRGIYLTAIQEAKKRGVKSEGGQPEPPTYNFFERTSLLRASVTFLQDFSKNLSECSPGSDEAENLLQSAGLILHSLGQPLNRPFPALNWSFLNEVKNAVDKWASKKSDYWKQRIRHGIIRVTAQQCNKSSSAFNVISKWLSVPESLTKSDELELLSVLDQLGRGLTANVLQPFLSGSLQAHLKDSKYLEVLLKKIKPHLTSDLIQGPNRSVLGTVIENLNNKIDKENEDLYLAYMSCVEDLPQKAIERLTSPSSWWEVTDEKLYAAARLRCYVASHERNTNGLEWLNDLIDATASLPGDRSHFLLRITEVFIKRSDSSQSTEWFITLLGRLKEHLKRDPGDSLVLKHERSQRIIFYMDLLVMSLLVWSGAWAVSSIDKLASVCVLRERLLCSSVVSLHGRQDWSKTLEQLLNWLVLTLSSLKEVVSQKYDLVSILLLLASLSSNIQQNFWNKIVATLWQEMHSN